MGSASITTQRSTGSRCTTGMAEQLPLQAAVSTALSTSSRSSMSLAGERFIMTTPASCRAWPSQPTTDAQSCRAVRAAFLTHGCCAAPRRPYEIDGCNVNVPELIPFAYNNTVSITAPLAPMHRVHDDRPLYLVFTASFRVLWCLSRQFYLPIRRTFQVSCSSKNLSLTEWQLAGYDAGSVQKTAPPLGQTLQLAREILGIAS
jgi:hypothetical protein